MISCLWRLYSCFYVLYFLSYCLYNYTAGNSPRPTLPSWVGRIGGWQEGDKEREVTNQMPGAFHPADDQELDDMRCDEVHTLPHDPSNIPRLGAVMGRGGRPPFRLGFAARGMRRGGAQ